MYKNTKKNRKIQLYCGFLGAFLTKNLGVSAKNILVDIFSNTIYEGKKSMRLSPLLKKNRIPGHLKKILKNAFLDSGIPIFTTLAYSKGHLTYQFSDKATAYFQKSEHSHVLKKEGKKKKAEKYIVMDTTEYKSLRSKHAKNLYIKILGWTDTYKLFVGKKEMATIFGFRKNKDMRKDVLLPAIAEINKKTSFNITQWHLHRFGRLVINFTPVVHKSPKKTKIDSRDEDKRIAVNFLVSEYNQSIPFAVKSYDVLGYDFLDSFVRIIAHKRRNRGLYSLEGYVYTVLSRKMRQKEYEAKGLSRLAS